LALEKKRIPNFYNVIVKPLESCYKSINGLVGPRARCIFNPHIIIKALAGYYNYYAIKCIKTIPQLGFI